MIYFGHATIPEPSLLTGSEKRQQQKSAGQSAAKMALQSAGFRGDLKALTIKNESSGRPIFVPPFIGSISHSENNAVAVATKDPIFLSIGIDLERISDKARRVISKTCTPEEQESVNKNAPFPSDLLATLFFSAKESFYKAVATEYKIAPTFMDLSLQIESTNCGECPGSLAGLHALFPIQRSGVCSYCMAPWLIDALGERIVRISYGISSDQQSVVTLTEVLPAN